MAAEPSLLVMSPLGFKARVGSALFELSRGIHVTLHIPWDSPLVWHLPTAWQLSHLFHITVRHWWDLKVGAIMPLLTVWDQADTVLTELFWLSSPRTYSSNFGNISLFDDSRTIWVLFRKWVLSKNQSFLEWRSNDYLLISLVLGEQTPSLHHGPIRFTIQHT